MERRNLIQFTFYTVMCILSAFIAIQAYMLVQIRYLLPVVLTLSFIWSILVSLSENLSLRNVTFDNLI